MKVSEVQLKRLKIISALMLVAAFFGLVLYFNREPLDWSKVRFRFWWFAIAVVLGMLQHILASLLWWKVLSSVGAHLRMSCAVRSYMIGDLGKYVPGKVWVIAGKAALVAREGVRLPLAVTAATQETLLVLVSGALVSVVYVTFGFKNIPRENIQLWFIVPILGVSLLVAVHPTSQRFMLRGLAPLLKRPEPQASFSLQKTFILVVMYCGLWVLAGILHLCLFVSISTSAPPDLLAMSGIVALATMLGFVSVFVPAGLGVREATMGSMLLPFASVEIIAVFILLARLVTTATQGMVTFVALALTGFAVDVSEEAPNTRQHCRLPRRLPDLKFPRS